MNIVQFNLAYSLPPEWDQLCDNYFQQKKFLIYCEQYNPCKQKYYCLYEEHKLIAGCVLYHSKVNLLTFGKRFFKINMKIIGIPVSVSCSGLIGNKKILIDLIIKQEKGILLIMNEEDGLTTKAIKAEFLPTIIFENRFIDENDYIRHMRKSYRRRFRKIQNVCLKSENDRFTKEHYAYYLQIMNKTQTKLETLSYEFFANLPEEFHLSTTKAKNQIIAWNITLLDRETLFFFFGGLNYEANSTYNAYFNNLFEIIFMGIRMRCKRIDLGQTAEIAKIRTGGKPLKKYVYGHHSNCLYYFFFKIIKYFLQYKNLIPELQVFKHENINDETKAF